MNTTAIDNSDKASSISFQTANGDIIVGLHAAKEYIKRMEILKQGKSISAQNQMEQEIQNCAQTFNISQETIEELKYLSDQTGMDTDTDFDVKEYDVADTDSEMSLISDSSSSEDTDDFDLGFSFSSLFGGGDNGDIDEGLFNNRPMLRGYRPMRRYRFMDNRHSLYDDQSPDQFESPPQPQQSSYDPLSIHIVHSMLMTFLLLGICACIWSLICGFGIGCLIKKKELRFKEQLEKDIENAVKSKQSITGSTDSKDVH